MRTRSSGARASAGDAINAVSKFFGMTALDHALERNPTEVAAVLRDELGGQRAADL